MAFQRPKFFVLRLWLTAFAGLVLCSCATFSMIQRLQATSAETDAYRSDTKTLRFVPMVHIGKPEYYADVKRVVTKAKQDGFVLFYEFIDFETANETEQRKLRKFAGFLPSPEGYERQLKPLLENGYVVQHNEQFLKLVNEKDFNVDITPQHLLSVYEHSYGPIELTKEDLDTPLDQSVEQTLPEDRMQEVLLKYRNRYLARQITKTQFSRIVVLYGAAHEEGLIEELRKLDPTWRALSP